MPAASRPAAPAILRQHGTAAVEFALVAIVFLLLVFGVIETARLMFVFNTLQEVTRRAAAAAVHVYPHDDNGILRLKQQAVFRDSSGELMLASPVTDASIRIDYLALTRDAASKALAMTPISSENIPATAARNRQICMGNPNAANCIRFVKVSVCSAATVAGAQCLPPTTRMLVPLLEMRIPAHRATTIATVESFGYVPGTSPCPCP